VLRTGAALSVNLCFCCESEQGGEGGSDEFGESRNGKFN
jgi:hypothetical protein